MAPYNQDDFSAERVTELFNPISKPRSLGLAIFL